MQACKLDTITMAVYARIGVDLARFVDYEYHAQARNLVRRLIAAHCDEDDVLGPWADEYQRRVIACLADEILTWHEDVGALW